MPKSPQFTSAMFSSFPATTKSQFIEISSETVHVGDDVTLSCIVEDDQDTDDVRSYVWNLNSEFRATFFYRFFSPLAPITRWDCIHFPPFFSLPVFPLFVCKLLRCHPDKKVINNEHFALRDNELLIRSAVMHLSGYYSCVVLFLNSGAKLETPHELINIVGEYNRCRTDLMHQSPWISIKTSSYHHRPKGKIERKLPGV